MAFYNSTRVSETPSGSTNDLQALCVAGICQPVALRMPCHAGSGRRGGDGVDVFARLDVCLPLKPALLAIYSKRYMHEELSQGMI